MTDWKVDLPEGTVGNVEVRRFEVTPDDARWSLWRDGYRAVRAGTYTGLYRGGRLWMSDTPAEQYDHQPAYWAMRERGGRVLIMGLGLGMVVKQALALPQVDHVDVVEIDPAVIELVGPSYAGDRCTIHQADAYTIQWPKGTRWSVMWADIWVDMSEDNLEGMARLARSYGRRADWKGYWGKAHVRAERRRWRGMGYGW